MKNFALLPFLFVGLFITSTSLKAQNAAISPGNIVACNTTIYDRGGSAGNYSSSSNEWITIAGRPGATITISGSYALETGGAYDYVYVRTGYGNAGTAYVTKTNGSGTISYTGAAGETLTVHLTSDGSGVAAGFALTITYSTAQTCPTTYSLSGTSTSVTCGNNYIVKDHAGDNTSYSNSRNDYMVFNGVSGSTAVLNIVGKYATESGFDYLRVYQGSGTGGTIVYGPLSGAGTFSFTGTAGVTYTLQFTSDGSIVDVGFSLFAYYTGSCVACTTPTTSYTVTGGGSYCSGGSGVAVGLSGSQSGVTYQLFNGASAVGSTVAGTGSAISFGNQTAAGTYTVKSTTAGGYCATSMTGSQTITINPSPYTPAAITGASSVCVGSSITLATAQPTASGGTFSTSGSSPNAYNICTFNGSGTFTVPTGVTLIGDVLAVGGGGGGGSNGGGGGGGGGVKYSTSVSIPAGGNTVTVGSGGTCCGSPAGNGGTSSLASLVVADGGGGGASRDAGAGGQTGGSGGGGAGASASPRHLGGGAGTNGTANAGGNGTTPDPGCNAAGGGGGGAGGAGSTASNNAAGNGGAGIAISISGSSVFYGGGGGGGTTNYLGCGISSTVLIPTSSNNAVTCGVNSTICANLGCGSGYSTYNDGYTVVNASGTATISISGTYDLEPSYDYMYIYSGVGTGGTLLYTYNGYGGTITPFTGTPGQSYTIRLTSDVSISGTGVSLNISYSGACTPAWTNGSGGSGGGSAGESGINGTANRGGGGGAETAGGSGVVIIRYPAGSWRSGDNSIATVDASGNVTGVSAGTVNIYYDIIAGSCTTSVSKSITINANPTANAGSALSAICQGATSAAMGGSVGGGATGGTWSGGAGTWTNASNPSTATYTAGASESGSITLTLTTSGGSCGTTTATKSITINANPTATAGSALSAICQGATSAAMGGSVGGGATGGTWSGGAGTWTNASNPSTATYTAGASESGSITLTLTTSGGSCGTTTATKSITINANPTATAGSALSAICQGATSAAMGGSVGGGATGGTWSGGAGTWTNASNPSTATYTAGASESGSITLTLTTSGGSCGTTTATKSITINANPTATAGSALSAICQGATSAAMGGSVGGGATGGTWSGGAGTWTNASNPSTATYTAGASESGSITLTLTTIGGSCGTTTATKSITVNTTPSTALAGIDQSNCNNSSFTLTGNNPSVGTGAWSLVSGTATITTPSANNSGVTGVTLGTSATLRWTISNGACTASTDDVVLTNNSTATVPTSGGDQEACYKASVPNLTVTVGGGETADWYDAASGGTLVKTGSLTFNEATDGSGPNPTPATYTYYVEGRNTTSGCVSTTRTAVILTIRAVPVISPTATPNTSCAGDNIALDANATAGSGTITSYAWSTGLVGSVASGTVTPTVSTLYAVTVTNSYSCTNAASDSVTVKSASAFMTLPSSSVTTCVEQCSDGGWTYYANAATPDDWTFAIRKNGNTFTAQVDITVLGSTINNINTSKTGYEHGSYLMKRYWDASILSGSISSSVDVKFFYDPSEKTAALSARDAAWTTYSATATKTPFRWFKTVGTSFGSVISTINGNSFSNFSNITLTESASGTENGITYAQFNGITSFSGGTGGYGFSSPGTGLPVKLLYFTATAVENNFIKLDWSTSLEIDNKGFEIERSTDGIRFDKIGWIDGHGNSTQTIVYAFNDKTAQANTVYYYRLKQIDFDADVEYSNIASAIFKDGKGFTLADLYPNPATNKVVINVATDIAQDAKIKIFDLLGQPVLVNEVKLVSGSNNFELDLADFAGGTYTVSIFSGNQYITKKLVISK